MAATQHSEDTVNSEGKSSGSTKHIEEMKRAGSV